MTRERRVDLVVVGGGAMGLATGWWAAGQADVVVLDRFAHGHHRGASHGGERIFRYAYADAAYVEMALAAEEGWERLEREAGRRLLERVGCVEHGPDAAVAHRADLAERLGITVRTLTAGEAERRWPGLRFESDVLVQPTAGWVRAADALDALAQLTEARGAEVRFDTCVLRIDATDDDAVRVHLAGEVYAATAVVVTAGAWVTTLLPEHWFPSLTTTEEHVFFFEPRRAQWPPVPTFLHWAETDLYGLPAADALVKVGEHQTGDVTTADGRTFAPDPARVDRIERYVAAWLPALRPTVVRATTCLFTSTPSADFVLDRVGTVVVGSGFSGHGFKFAPEIGRRLARMALAGMPPRAPFALSSHRGRASNPDRP